MHVSVVLQRVTFFSQLSDRQSSFLDTVLIKLAASFALAGKPQPASSDPQKKPSLKLRTYHATRRQTGSWGWSSFGVEPRAGLARWAFFIQLSSLALHASPGVGLLDDNIQIVAAPR